MCEQVVYDAAGRQRYSRRQLRIDASLHIRARLSRSENPELEVQEFPRLGIRIKRALYESVFSRMFAQNFGWPSEWSGTRPVRETATRMKKLLFEQSRGNERLALLDPN